MENRSLLQLIVACSLLALAACESGKKDGAETGSTEIVNEELAAYGGKFRKLMLTDEGIVRGFDFGTDTATVRQNETAQLLARDEESFSYTLQFNEFEACDIIYHYNEGKIDRFTLDMYLKNAPSADSLITDFRNYFNDKFGNAETAGDTLMQWENPDGTVLLKYINENIDQGIHIEIFEKQQEEDIVEFN